MNKQCKNCDYKKKNIENPKMSNCLFFEDCIYYKKYQQILDKEYPIKDFIKSCNNR